MNKAKVVGKGGSRSRSRRNRRHWNWRRALGNLLTLAGIVAAGLFLAYLLLSWLAGAPW